MENHHVRIRKVDIAGKIHPELKRRLCELAEKDDRTLSYMLGKAIQNYVNSLDPQIEKEIYD